MQYSSHHRRSKSTFSSEIFWSLPVAGWRNSRRTLNSSGHLPGNLISLVCFSFISCDNILRKTGEANVRTDAWVRISARASSSNTMVMSCTEIAQTLQLSPGEYWLGPPVPLPGVTPTRALKDTSIRGSLWGLVLHVSANRRQRLLPVWALKLQNRPGIINIPFGKLT